MWHAIGRQFRNPSGLGGQVMGHVMRAINSRPNREAISALQIKPDECALDLGCGPGAAVREMSRLAPRGRIHGVDQSQVMINQATRRNRQGIAAGRVTLHRAAFEVLPLMDASIDKVLAVNVAYFWTDIPAVLKEITRVLRPGGTLAVYVTDGAAMRRWKFAGPLTHRLFGDAELREALTGSPFSPSSVTIEAVSAGPGVRGLVATARKPSGDRLSSSPS